MGRVRIRTILGVAACKLSRAALRLKKSGGTSLPGRAAMLFDRNILGELSRGVETIVVTGTNGKTTTCRLLAAALAAEGKEVLANRSGANLLQGVTAEFAANAGFLGRPKKKYAVIECDEGAFPRVASLVRPKVIVVTNLFRDQLDRYGEVMHTLEQIRAGIRQVPKSRLCLNADCPLTSSLAEEASATPVFFGVDVPVGEQKEPELSDARYCIRCQSAYRYEYRTYAHLGGYYCPVCGYRRPAPRISVTGLKLRGAAGTDAVMTFRDPGKEPVSKEVRIRLPAVYNLYNALAAAAACTAAGYDRDNMLRSLAGTGNSFGRMETFQAGKAQIQMILVKNPAGCNQTLDYLLSLDEDYAAVLCLNDQAADGTDISWIWDVEYEKLAEDPHLKRVMVSGERAEDMRLRLKYAGIPEEITELVHGWEKLAGEMENSSLPVFVLPNYTSMLALRRVLAKDAGKEEFWKG